MAEAGVIPLAGMRDGDGPRPSRPSRSSRGSRVPPGYRGDGTRGDAAGSVAAGAARAAGERARRRRSSTPLIGGEALASSPEQPRDPAPTPRDTRTTSTTSTRRTTHTAEDAGRDHRVAEVVREARQVGEELAAASPDSPNWERRVAAALAFLRRRITGDYEIDDFGHDPELTDGVLMALLRPLYRAWFRVEVSGVDNVPAQGGALVVGNHSGTIAFDALMTQLALLDTHPARRPLRMLAADLVFALPFAGELARKSGATLACAEDAQRLLSAGELVGVWPEGFKGIGKPYRERYKLQRFGRGGFVAAALRTGAPIVPCSIVGAEETYPMLANLKTLARLLGLPYVPVTPTFPWLGPLGLVPLPSKWRIDFGAPIPTDTHGPAAADDPMLVFNLTDQIRETIQHTLYRLLMQRRSIFF